MKFLSEQVDLLHTRNRWKRYGEDYIRQRSSKATYADNVTADPGTGGATFRTDDDGTAHWPYVKLAWGADNTQTIVAAGGDAIPIQDGGNAITVDGTVAVTNTGTFAVQVDGAALTALQLIDDAIYVDDADWTDNTSKHVLVGGLYQSIQQTVTDGDVAPFQVNAQGILMVDAPNTVFVNETGSALAALQLIDDAIFADDAAFTQGTSRLMVIGCIADETSTDTVSEHDVGVPRMTLDRKVIVTPQPHTAGGLSIMRSIDLDESEETVKATAGAVYGMWVTNTATSTRFVKFYNATVANVSVGTTTPVITIGIPGNSSDDISGVFNTGGMGIAFDTAITVAATTGVADNDTGAPSANDVICNIFYA